MIFAKTWGGEKGFFPFENRVSFRSFAALVFKWRNYFMNIPVPLKGRKGVFPGFQRVSQSWKTIQVDTHQFGEFRVEMCPPILYLSVPPPSFLGE